MNLRALLPPAAAAAVALAACGGGRAVLPDADAAATTATPAPDSFVVAFETTRGTFEVKAHRGWSPHAVDRFHELVSRGYYTDVPVFRVVEGYVAQFGIHPDPEVAEAWLDEGVPDEPVRAANERGRVAFARGGPDTRGVQLFINLADNSPRLDTMTVEGVTGYPPIGEVIAGMAVVDAFEDRYGNDPARYQDSIIALGDDYLERVFPGLDVIREARVVREWR